MIRVSGTTDGPEAAAARELCRILVLSWPWVEHDSRATVEVVAGVQCHGQSTRDLDVVLFATFPSPRGSSRSLTSSVVGITGG